MARPIFGRVLDGNEWLREMQRMCDEPGYREKVEKGIAEALPKQKKTKMEYYVGTHEYVTDMANKFMESMGRRHPDTFHIVNINTVSVPLGVAMYITYEV